MSDTWTCPHGLEATNRGDCSACDDFDSRPDPAMMTVANLTAGSMRWPSVLSDKAWHGPEGYLLGDWELTLLELGQRAANRAVEEWEFPSATATFVLIAEFGGHVHEYQMLCVDCGHAQGEPLLRGFLAEMKDEQP